MFLTWKTAEAVVQQDPADQVGEQVAAQVPDVRVAVDGRAARVHPDATGLDRLDRSDGAGEGVAKAEGHGKARGGWGRGHRTRALEGPSARSPVYSRRCAAPRPAPPLSACSSRYRWWVAPRVSGPPMRPSGSSRARRRPSTRRCRAMSTSAAITAQLFETLTTFDADLQAAAGARRVVADRRRAAAGSSSISDRTSPSRTEARCVPATSSAAGSG